MPDAADRTPPARHALRLVALDFERSLDGDVRGWMPVTEHVRCPSGGAGLAAVAMLVDALGGARSLPAADPDWAITADLTIHLLPTGPVDELEAAVHVRRRGRRTLVLDVDLLADGTVPAGTAMVSFAVVARPPHLAGMDFSEVCARRPMLPPLDDALEAGLDRPYLDELGIAEQATGVMSVALRPEVSNNLGALHGAVHTAMVDAASASLGRSLLRGAVETTDLHLAFLELARPGPLTATATAVGPPSPDGDRLAVEVRLVDGDGRLCSYATTAVGAS